jgi:putative ABC transport system substrate-binding protein
MAVGIRRRQFISALGGTALAWPFAARAQQSDRVRRIGVLVPQAESDPEQRSWITAFATRLRELGWTQGKNLQIDYRWAGGDPTRMPTLAKELIEQQPDVLLAATPTAAVAARQYTLAIPIVFTQVVDPVAFGLVTNLARPEGNITGFTVFEFAIGGKWVQLLKECAPSVTRAAIFFDPSSTPWPQYVRAIETAARSLGVQLIPFPVQSDAEIERAFAEFITKPSGAIIAIPSGSVLLHREKIIALAARHRLPAMYPYRLFVVEGGLMSYGTDLLDQYRQAASYVDRILKGEKPADLPVQLPTKYQLVINLKTAKAQGLTVPPLMLSRADEVIE